MPFRANARAVFWPMPVFFFVLCVNEGSVFYVTERMQGVENAVCKSVTKGEVVKNVPEAAPVMKAAPRRRDAMMKLTRFALGHADPTTAIEGIYEGL